MSHEIHKHVCMREETGLEVKCVERSDDANFAKSKISQQRPMAASLPGWKHAKTPLKHVEHVASTQTTVLEYCLPPFKSFHPPPLGVYASSPYQRPPCPPVYTIEESLSLPGLLCSTQTTPPSLSITPPPHRQTRSLQGGISRATGEDVRLQARYVSSHPINSTRKIRSTCHLNGSGIERGISPDKNKTDMT
jgi:hypothetical protein